MAGSTRRARLAIVAIIVVGTIVALLLGRCEGENDDVAAALRGLRWEMPCKPGHQGPFCSAAVQKPVVTATLAGDPARQYDVTLRFRGVVEWEVYADGRAEEPWYVGGHPDNSINNIYQLGISEPAQVFYLNAPGANDSLGRVWSIDYQKTIRVQGGATVTLSADAQDGNLVSNTDDKGKPLVIPAVPPAPAAFDGQFIQMDVVSVVPAPAPAPAPAGKP
jgi:hypothetical protein